MNFIEHLFVKRFCLPSNIDLTLCKNEELKINECLCGNYNHVACILSEKRFEKDDYIEYWVQQNE